MPPVIINSTVESLVLPLVAPFRISQRTAYEAHNVLFQLFTQEGVCGLGAGAPVEYVTGETISTVVADLEQASSVLMGVNCERLEPLLALAEDLLPNRPTARTALEMALLDLWGKNWNIPLWQYFGGSRVSLTADLTIPIVSPDEAKSRVAEAWANGFEHFKIKVGDPQGIDADYARIAAVVEAAPDSTLRVDANQGFTADSAVEFIRKALIIAPNIEIVEQPVPKEDIESLVSVHERMRGLPILLFADESAQSVASVVELIRRDAVDGINVKLMKSGIAGAWKIASLCHAHGIKLMVGCMLESRLPLTAACALVAGTGWFDFVDLDSHHLLSPSAIFSGGFESEGGVLVPEMHRPGWGVAL